MSFTPHTPHDIKAMLEALNIQAVTDLFDEIPASLRNEKLEHVPSAMTELDITRLMQARADEDKVLTCFAGCGAYDHYIPAAVWDIVSRGENMTAYTPYQAEASQGGLQLIYEYQSMMASLMGMEVSNASMYDGASALAEAVLMAIRSQRKATNKRVIIPKTVNWRYIDVVKTICEIQDVELDIIDYDKTTGRIDEALLQTALNEPACAVVVPQPNIFGVLEEVDSLVNLIHKAGSLAIAVVNPLAMTMLKPPGEWGEQGADIACGEGQPLGVPMAHGGPYFGFMTCRKSLIRQMPGRLVARTHDDQNRVGYTLTLQAREQHIRRSKATSNICTNQGLMVTAATIFMSIMGAEGLKKMALQSYQNMQALKNKMASQLGIQPLYATPNWHECAFDVKTSALNIIKRMADKGILAGVACPESLGATTLIVCTTEMRTEDEINRYVEALRDAMQQGVKQSSEAVSV